MGTLAVAGFLTSLVLAPVIDSFICSNEVTSAAASTASIAVNDSHAAPADDHGQSSSNHASDGGCIHGHCHDGVTMTVALVEGVDSPLGVVQAHNRVPDSVRTTRVPFGLERPPRA